jgi:hypothetical protein
MAISKQKSFLELVPFFGPFLIFLGISRLLSYYSVFGINIATYLDFSEILTSFFDLFVMLSFFFSTMFIQGFLSANKESEESVMKKRQILEEKYFFKRIILYSSYYLGSLVWAIFYASCYFLVSRIFDKSMTWGNLFYSYLFALVFYIFLIFLNEIEIKHKQFKSSDSFRFWMQLLIYSILVVTLIIYVGYRQAKSVMNTKFYYGTTIELENNIRIVSDSSTYFIGNTKNYLYMYHEKDSAVDIIPLTRVKQITYKHPRI